MITCTAEPNVATFAKNPIYFEFEVDHVLLPANHVVKVLVQVEKVYGTNAYENIVTLEETVNNANYATFDISSIIDAVFGMNEQLYGMNNPNPYMADNRRRYKIAYTESYGDPIVEQTWLEKTGYIAYFGGIDQQRFAQFNFFAGMYADNSLWSYYPSRKTVSPAQTEYLKWYNYTGSTKSILLEIRQWTETGEGTKLYLMPFSAQDASVSLLPCGYTQLELINFILKYQVRVVDATSSWETGNPVYFSQAITYYVDWKEYEETYYIAYSNVFGLPETLRVTASLKVELDITRTFSSSFLRKGYTAYEREIRQVAVEWQNEYTFRTGYITKAEKDALQELLLAGECYLLDEEGYFPMQIEDRKFNISESFQFLYALEFNAIRALKAKNYSNDLVQITAANTISPTPNQGVVRVFPDAWDIENVTSLLGTDEILILRDGVLKLVAPDEAMKYWVSKMASMNAYISIEAALAAGLQAGEAFLAADPNIMGETPGAFVLIPFA